jgi:hypothetical protein
VSFTGDRSRTDLVDSILALLLPGFAAVGADRVSGPLARPQV